MASTVPIPRTTARQKEGGRPPRSEQTQPQQPHPRRLPSSAPEGDEVDACEQQQTRRQQQADEPLRTQRSEEGGDERDQGRQRDVGQEHDRRVDPERDRPSHRSGEGDGGGPITTLDTVVELGGPGTNAADQLLGEPGRLSSERGSHLRALDDLSDREAHLVTGERVLDGAVERAAGGKLSHDTVENLMPDRRLDDLFRQRGRERAVDQGCKFRHEHVVRCRRQPVAGGARRDARREEREAFRGRHEPGRALVAGGH